MVRMYHEIDQPYALLYNLDPALKLGARVGIVDANGPKQNRIQGAGSGPERRSRTPGETYGPSGAGAIRVAATAAEMPCALAYFARMTWLSFQM